MPRFLTHEELRLTLQGWQKALSLQDFRIDVKLVRASHLDMGQKSLGECDLFLMKKRALIRILDAADYGDPEELYDDHETVLVHELLHIVVPKRIFDLPIDENNVKYQMYEQGIDQLARALVSLKRKGLSDDV